MAYTYIFTELYIIYIQHRSVITYNRVITKIRVGVQYSILRALAIIYVRSTLYSGVLLYVQYSCTHVHVLQCI